MKLFSQILITSDFDKAISQIEREAKTQDINTLPIVREGNFLVKDVDLAMQKAYISSDKKEIIILGAKVFSEIVQNRLLKLLEEPPRDKEFILLFENKSAILNTIKSRLPIIVLDRVDDESIEILDIRNFTIKECYEFVQKHKRDSNQEIKLIVQKIFKEAMKSRRFKFDKKDLDTFSDAVVALDYGAVGGAVLIGVLLKLLEIKRD